MEWGLGDREEDIPTIEADQHTLSSFGMDGWELVSVIVTRGNRFAYLKRAVTE